MLSHVSGMHELSRYVEPVALLVVDGLAQLRIEHVQVATKDVVRVVGWMSVRIVRRSRAVLPLKNLAEA